MVKVVLWVIDISVIVLSVVWYLNEKSIEPIITGLMALGGLIMLVFSNKKSESNNTFKQKSGKKSTQYQAGGDITINNKKK